MKEEGAKCFKSIAVSEIALSPSQELLVSNGRRNLKNTVGTLLLQSSSRVTLGSDNIDAAFSEL